jgi:hypothetical protein
MARTANRLSLRDKLDELMPGWDRWYPSVFDAAQDLGLIRARVCPPSQLLLSNRHAAVNGEAVESFRRRWAIEHDPEVDGPAHRAGRGGPRRKPRMWRR